ncbi:flagellum-specific peptidoglycan hydrolase FlgJ [Lutibacter sp. Hel_I_33_5]|uniref:glucosaminidase domain-containing protein n=1 Tax=Lutibacter sp. Hel_I_33_5 TaxID=1566289 RepID=UPI0011A0D664|nr:glucosaminidase domain-containing protein [Lutibacter sp. Hel_I_33_5]TVZ56774.1 flagellum-specific peptidoglycan hydrolase FlgJ [Lutibacter sp. Hel_I_33_5]
MRLKLVFFYVLLSFILVGCGASKKITKPKKTVVSVEPKPVKLPSVKQQKHIKKLTNKNPRLNKNTLNYIKKYASLAVHEMHLYKIPASITLAQGVLESGSGRGQLASKSNNHFGIKCHTTWQGARVYYDDDAKGECFRKYQYVATSYRDHSKFLSARKRYAFLFNFSRKDYKSWARGLKKAGYATDKKYPKKLIKIIKDYKLYEFDKISKRDFKKFTKESPTSEEKKSNKKYYTIKKGDTLYSLARKFNLTVAKLKSMNGLRNNSLSIGQELKVK